MLETGAFESTLIAAARPSPSVGNSSNSASVILGASLGLAGTPDVFGDVYVASSAGSVETILMVSIVAEPTAAFNFAEYSTVFDV